jgi:hypothetical protein
MKRYQENHFQMELWSGMILLPHQHAYTLHKETLKCTHSSVDTSSTLKLSIPLLHILKYSLHTLYISLNWCTGHVCQQSACLPACLSNKCQCKPRCSCQCNKKHETHSFYKQCTFCVSFGISHAQTPSTWFGQVI